MGPPPPRRGHVTGTALTHALTEQLRLRQQLEACQTRLEQMREDLRTARDERDALQGQLDDLQQQLDEAARKRRNLRRQLTVYKDNLARFRASSSRR